MRSEKEESLVQSGVSLSLSLRAKIIPSFASSLSLSWCSAFCFRLTKLCFRHSDIDQLTRILLLCGTPDSEFLHKITSDEVSAKYKLRQTYFFTFFQVRSFLLLIVTPLSLHDHHVCSCRLATT